MTREKFENVRVPCTRSKRRTGGQAGFLRAGIQLSLVVDSIERAMMDGGVTTADGGVTTADGLVIGLISTGAMSTAQAQLFASNGFSVFIGSRDATKAAALAAKVGQGARGGTHDEAIKASDLVFLNIMPGEITKTFLETYREQLARKMLVEPAAPYYYSAERHPPPPHESTLTWDKEVLNDDSVSWATTFKSMGTASVGGNRQQPIEVCGDARAKGAVMRVLATCGWEPLDCGGVEDAPTLEPRGPRRRKHPRIAEYDAANGMHPAARAPPT